jgi:hypothetical protein
VTFLQERTARWIYCDGCDRNRASASAPAVVYGGVARHPRNQRYISRLTLVLLRPALRFSHSRDAYVLRFVGTHAGPVFSRDRLHTRRSDTVRAITVDRPTDLQRQSHAQAAESLAYFPRVRPELEGGYVDRDPT